MKFNEVFQYKKMNEEKMRAFGFIELKASYEITLPLLHTLSICVTITKQGEVDYKVVDDFAKEEYVLVKVASATGEFVQEVREACKSILQEIAEQCFDLEVYRFQQAQRMVSYIQETYAISPEFPWGSYPDSAVFRHPHNQKWFALIMPLDAQKINPSYSGMVEIMDLKATPETVQELLTQTGYEKGYHMNKKYWYTIILDGTLEDEEIIGRISDSFTLTYGKTKKAR